MRLSILVLSLARCGSSALYDKLVRNLDCVGFFEPRNSEDWENISSEIKEADNYVVKSILRPYLSFGENNALWFDRVVALVRDPRDNLISRLLFRLISPSFVSNKENISHVYDLLYQKVNNPKEISLVNIFRSMEATKLMESFIDERVEENLSLMSEWILTHPEAMVFHYEDLISNQFAKLSEYLGISLEVPMQDVPRIKRAGGRGEWREWFTPEDVNFFRPRMMHFMERFGYRGNWDLADAPIIDPSTSLDYINQHIASSGF